MVVPFFIKHEPLQPTLLSISINEGQNVGEWCVDLAGTFKKHDVKGIVFISGQLAEKNPECIKTLPKKIDVGSKGYQNTSITAISDYTNQLEEVKRGKDSIDKIAGIDSKSFKAPLGATDDNIYSLLQRNNILVDFSYQDKYHKFHNGQFIWFKINSLSGKDFDLTNFLQIISTNKQKNNLTPIVINFDNTVPVEKIDAVISQLKSTKILFVNGSDLVGYEITKKGEGSI